MGVLGVIGLLVAAGLSGNLLFAVMAMVVLVVLLINLVAVWPRPRRRLQRWLLPLAILDEIMIGVLLILSGGVTSPFVLLFLFVIGQVAIGSSMREALGIAALSSVLYTALVLPVHWAGSTFSIPSLESWQIFNIVGVDLIFGIFAWAAGQVGRAFRLQQDRFLLHSTRLRRQVTALVRLARMSRRQNDLLPNLVEILEKAVEDLEVARAAIILREREDMAGQVILTHHFAEDSAEPPVADLPRHPVVRFVLEQKRPVTAARLMRQSRKFAPDLPLFQMAPGAASAPLLVGDVCLGCLYCDQERRPKRWSDEAIELLEAFADLAAVSIENHRLYSQVLAEKSKLEATMGAVTDALLIYDVDGRILLANEPFRQLFDMGEWAHGLTVQDLLTFVHERSRLGLLDGLDIKEDLFDVKPAEIEIGLPPHSLQRRGQAVFDESGKPVAYVVTFHDVTEEQQAERVRSEILASVSHELRTPLTSIKGFMQIFERRFNRNEALASAQELRLVLQQVEHLSVLVDDLLDVSRWPGSKLHIQRSWVHISRLVAEGATRCSRETGRIINIDDQSRSALGFWDRDKVKQALYSLLSNAVKYSEDHTTVLVSCVLDDDRVRISVRDQGIGLNAEQADHIFEAFYRADNSTTRRTNGLGIGLYLCRRIAEAHDGSVHVRSQLGAGSEFVLLLPGVQRSPAGALPTRISEEFSSRE